MAQRLTFEVEVLRDVVKTFDTMFVADKLYDYANYITIYGTRTKIVFEMCVIMDGASKDAMVRLYVPNEGTPFDALVINFAQLRGIIKSFKAETCDFILEGTSLTMQSGKVTHLAESSMVTIPRQITEILNDFFNQDDTKMVDFNLLKLYNNMNDIGANLTINTLKSELFGIMNTPEFMVSTDGFSMGIYQDGQLNESFMFPKHSLRILKMLPKIGAKYAIVNHRIYITGVGFQCYIGEWSGYKNYPVAGIQKFINLTPRTINDPMGALNAIKQCHQFDDLAVVNFGKGIAQNKRGTHVEEFEPTPEFGDAILTLHKSVLTTVDSADVFMADPEKCVCKLIIGTKLYIFLGVTND